MNHRAGLEERGGTRAVNHRAGLEERGGTRAVKHRAGLEQRSGTRAVKLRTGRPIQGETRSIGPHKGPTVRVLSLDGDVPASTGEEWRKPRVEMPGVLVNPARNKVKANDYAYAMAA